MGSWCVEGSDDGSGGGGSGGGGGGGGGGGNKVKWFSRWFWLFVWVEKNMGWRKSNDVPFWCSVVVIGVKADFVVVVVVVVDDDDDDDDSVISLCNWFWNDTILSPSVIKWSIVLAKSPWHVDNAAISIERFCIGKTRSSISIGDIFCRRNLLRGDTLFVCCSSVIEPDESSFECIPDVFDVVVVPSSALRLVELVGLLPVFGEDPDTIDSWSFRGEFDDEAWSPE